MATARVQWCCYTVRLSFDRLRIIDMACSLHSGEKWCQHVISLAIHRIDHPQDVEYRLPVSDTVQRLSEVQQKQFISTLLSQLQLDVLLPAQRILDSIISSTVSSATGVGDGCEIYGLPDATAGGGLSEDAVWCFDEQYVRSAIDVHCLAEKGSGRSFIVDGSTHPLTEQWVSAVKYQRRYNQLMNCVNDEETGDELLPDDVSDRLESTKELGKIFHTVNDMLSRGDPCCVTILDVATEQWMKCLETKAGLRMNGRHEDYEGAQDSTALMSLPGDNTPKQSPASEAGEHEYCTNSELLNAGELTTCFPDCITALWRSVVLCPKLNDKLLDDVEGMLSKWGSRLDIVVSAGLLRTQNIGRTQVQATEWSSSRLQACDEELWLSLSGWNGFKHVQALTNRETRLTMRSLQNVLFQSTPSDVYLLTSLYALNTSALIVQVFEARGLEREANQIAKTSVQSLLSAIRDNSAGVTTHNATDSASNSPVMMLVNEVHERAGTNLGGSQKQLVTALCILFKAIYSEEWIWADSDAFDVGKLMDWSTSPASAEISNLQPVPTHVQRTVLKTVPAVVLGISCLLLPIGCFSTAVELDLVREKNNLVSSLIPRLFCKVDESGDVMRDVFCPLVSLIVNCSSRLDPAAMAQFLLHAILADQSSSTHRLDSDKILPAVAAVVRDQGIWLTNPPSQTIPHMEVIGHCRVAVHAATILLALKCYGQSESSRSLIVHSIVEPLYATDQTWLQVIQSDIVKIVWLVIGSDGRRYGRSEASFPIGSHLRPSLSERLSQLESPAADLTASLEIGWEKLITKDSDPFQLQVAAMELLLLLLKVDSAVCSGDTFHRSCRKALLELLGNVVGCVGATRFLESVWVHGCPSILSADELLLYFLSREDFQASLVSRVQMVADGYEKLRDALQTLLIYCAANLRREDSSGLFAATKKMGLVDCLREAVLSAGADTKLQFSQRLLFCLAGNAEGNATPPERLEIGYLALRNWHEYAITRPCTAALFSWNYSGLDDNQSSLLCLLHLVVSLAVLTDTDGSPQAIDETESTGLSAVGRLVEIVKNGYAFDPLFAFMVLLEAHRLSRLEEQTAAGYLQYETVTNSSLMAFLSEQQTCMIRSDTAASFQEMCARPELAGALEIVQRCKVAILAILKRYMSPPLLSCVSEFVSRVERSLSSSAVGDISRLRRRALLHDFVCLHFLFKAFPEPDFKFDRLVEPQEYDLPTPRQSLSSASERHTFVRVLEEFRQLVS